MKKNMIIGFSVVCVATIAILLVITSGEEAKAFSEGKGLFVTKIEGAYNLGTIDSEAIFKVFNVSLTNTVTLGDVHIVDPVGNKKVWSGLIETLQPLESRSFRMSETGIPHGYVYLVGISWQGQANDLKVSGWVENHVGSDFKGSRTIFPFSGEIGK